MFEKFCGASRTKITAAVVPYRGAAIKPVLLLPQ
jgi:hypothetical protein